MQEQKVTDGPAASAIIEAALFLSHEPLSSQQLARICNVPLQEINDALQKFKLDLERKERGLLLLETEAGFQLGTKPEIAAWLEKLFAEDSLHAPLSQAALETLSIIALKQPVTRIEIEKIRGVKAEGVIENLLKKGLIKVAGRKEGLGRPFLYETTEEFIHYFGFKNLEELEVLKKELQTF